MRNKRYPIIKRSFLGSDKFILPYLMYWKSAVLHINILLQCFLIWISIYGHHLIPFFDPSQTIILSNDTFRSNSRNFKPENIFIIKSSASKYVSRWSATLLWATFFLIRLIYTAVNAPSSTSMLSHFSGTNGQNWLKFEELWKRWTINISTKNYLLIKNSAFLAKIIILKALVLMPQNIPHRFRVARRPVERFTAMHVTLVARAPT